MHHLGYILCGCTTKKREVINITILISLNDAKSQSLQSLVCEGRGYKHVC